MASFISIIPLSKRQNFIFAAGVVSTNIFLHKGESLAFVFAEEWRWEVFERA